MVSKGCHQAHRRLLQEYFQKSTPVRLVTIPLLHENKKPLQVQCSFKFEPETMISATNSTNEEFVVVTKIDAIKLIGDYFQNIFNNRLRLVLRINPHLNLNLL